MFACMGMKIEEWEDGRINVGFAVCPQPAAKGLETDDVVGDTRVSNRKCMVPNSAFVVRAPKSHQSQGVTVTYAHHDTGVSDLIIMLRGAQSEDHGQSDQISPLSHLQNQLDRMQVSENAGVDNASSISCPEKDESSKSAEVVEKSESGNVTITVESCSSGLASPQVSLDEVENGAGQLIRSKSEASGKSGDMKRVSWVEENEVFEDKPRNNSKEGKSRRKSKGERGSSKKQNIENGEEYTQKRSEDKSRIPVLTSSAISGDYPTSCEFYRRKMLNELYSAPSDNWYGYSSIQRYAGQKVVRKIAAEQKRLEEDISNRRKTEIWILANDSDEFMLTPPAIPIRKKPMRLKPLQIVH